MYTLCKAANSPLVPTKAYMQRLCFLGIIIVHCQNRCVLSLCITTSIISGCKPTNKIGLASCVVSNNGQCQYHSKSLFIHIYIYDIAFAITHLPPRYFNDSQGRYL